MKYLKITNKGELDIRIVALMGGTTKAQDSNKIGNFGTGLKYTLAYLLRNNIDIKLFSGEKQTNITIEKEQIGENLFEILCINGKRTSITTQMGHDWKAWMIIRELYSNALDEGDAAYEITENITSKSGITSFYIEFTPLIMEVYNNWDKFFMIGKEPIYEDNNIKIYPQSGCLKIYKQGILIHSIKEQKSLFNYDISNANINELREYQGYLEGDLAQIIYKIKDKKVIQYFLENLTEDHYESNIDYSYWNEYFNDSWKESLDGIKIITQKSVDNINARGLKVDINANIVVPESLYKGLSIKFEGVGALRISKAINDFYEIYNERLHDKVRKAQEILENTGYFIEPELSYIYGVFGDKNVLAKIDMDSKKIYISEKHLDQDLFSICTMLVEENEHYKTGLSDETREFQQHFINLYTNSIIEKNSIKVL